MAAPSKEVLASYFPNIDEEVSNYINGILTSEISEFQSPEDLYEAVGDVLLENDAERCEEEIKDICDRLFHVLKDDDSARKDGPIKILESPVHLGSLASNTNGDAEDSASIWLARQSKSSTVDKKKLLKAEAKIKQKQERKQQDDLKPKSEGNAFDNSASASQQTSRKDNKFDSLGSNKTYDIRLDNFDIAFGERVLLSGANISMVQGRRYGLVGRNGMGKTTLLKMLSIGSLKIPSHITILHVEQEVVGDETIALQSVLESDEKREKLLLEEKNLTALLNASPKAGSDYSTRLNKVYQELEAIEADKAPARAGMILAGLGFTAGMQKQCTKTFSGGWRMRLALARALFSKPDLLLLDEPTNMLDMKAIIWLETYLQTWSSTILCVSHDRQFLNSIATDILHLHSRRIDYYRGDYETFVKTRTEKLKNQQKEYEAQSMYRQHIQVFIDRFRYNANRASQVQSKLKLLEKLPPLVPVEKESDVVLRFPEAEGLSPPILQLDEVTFYYSKEKPIFNNVNISAAMDSRICIVGENGAGKTTLLKILLGNLEPVKGIRHVHRNLRIGYFSQHHVDSMDMNMNSVEVIASKIPGKTTEVYRGQLGSFGISGDLALRIVSSLSGGQKSRLAFAMMSCTNPNFFILDEPTNHLDMETIEALAKALNKFQGGVILVSHDERLIRMVCSEVWICKDGKVRSLEGGLDAYKTLVNEELAAQL